VCRALCPDVADLPGFRRRSMVDFLGELCACVKRVDAHAKTTVVVLPQDLEQVDELAALPYLDTVGCHLFWELLDKDVEMVGQWGRSVSSVVRAKGKRSQLWLQNFNLDETGEGQMEDAFTQLMSAEPDDIACYYYWRNNAEPERVWRKTRELLRRIPRRQLHWHATSSNGMHPQREK
jgi:hypothetical protein